MDTASLFGLVGFFFGIVLQIFLLLLVLKRKRRTFETLLISLLTGLLIWYAGNFVSLLLRQMDIAKVAEVLKWFDIAAFTGLSFLPALMLHTHWIYYQNHFGAELKETRIFRFQIWLLYAQLLMLPLALSRLFVDPSIHPLQKLGPFTMPFLVSLLRTYSALQLLGIWSGRSSIGVLWPVPREPRPSGIPFPNLLGCLLHIPARLSPDNGSSECSVRNLGAADDPRLPGWH
jgi:hypothetical protein